MEKKDKTNNEKYKILFWKYITPLIPGYGYFEFRKEVKKQDKWMKNNKIKEEPKNIYNYGALGLLSVLSSGMAFWALFTQSLNYGLGRIYTKESSEIIATQSKNNYYNKKFQKYDLNEDGEVSNLEFMSKYDGDKSGTLDSTEFLNLLRKMDNVEHKGRQIYHSRYH